MGSGWAFKSMNMPTSPLTHISAALSAKLQWSLGSTSAVGWGVFAFLSDHYRPIAAICAIVGAIVGLHGAYWLCKNSKLEHKIKRLREERERLEIERLRENDE